MASEWEFDKRIPAHRAAKLLRELLGRVDDLERTIGQMRLLADLPLPPDVAVKLVEADRLRKLFDDAGQGEHNVLALIDHYQRNSMESDARLRAVRELLEENGGDCPCDHYFDEHGPRREVCLACRIGMAIERTGRS